MMVMHEFFWRRQPLQKRLGWELFGFAARVVPEACPVVVCRILEIGYAQSHACLGKGHC